MLHSSWRTAIRRLAASSARPSRSRTSAVLGRDTRLEDRFAPAVLTSSAIRTLRGPVAPVRQTLEAAAPVLHAPSMPGLAALDAAVAGAVLREWQVPVGTTTAQWVMGLGRGEDPQAVVGASARVTPTPYLPDTYLVEFPTPVAVAEAAGQFRGAAFYYPLVAQQQTPRFIPNDEFFAKQWHLRNTGQTGGLAGADARLTSAWDKFTANNSRITGTGVLIGIVDDGLQHSHPDLQPNYVAAHSYDFNFNDPDPDPGSGGSDNHGTAVAGVAAARGNNTIGVSGAAPTASLAGLRLISQATTDQDEANALSYHRDAIDIYSNSWGPPDTGRLGRIGPLTLAALKANSLNGRGGLGNVYTWAAGNGLDADDNVNYDPYANSRFAIAVGAIDHNGKQAWYSEPGAPMLVTAYSSGPPGITTTDRTGGDGYNSGDYDNDFGGTSSATPLVSGVIALMLQANPNLTPRDVQNILVRTARKTDPTDPGWSVNKAGFHINHKYGFGAIDARAAVAMAQVWKTVKDEVQVAGPVVTVNKAIPDNNATGVSSSVPITRAIQVEHVEVVFDATHPNRGNLEVVLTAPSGTRSILAEQHDTDKGADYTKWVFSTVRDWGELSAGKWTLTVRDRAGGDVGTFNSWQLLVYGTAGIPPALSGIEATPVTALENASARVTGTLVVSDRNSATLSEATVAITDNYVPGEDKLEFTGSGSITGSLAADDAKCVLTLSGPGTVAEYQQALRTVRYVNASENPTTLARTLTFQVVDDTDSASNFVSRKLSVVRVNDAPSFSLPATEVAVSEDPVPARVKIEGFAADVSAGPAETDQLITFETAILNHADLFSNKPGEELVVSPNGTLFFTPAPDAYSLPGQAATIAVRIRDDAGTAYGGVNVSPWQTFTIAITPVDDAPRPRTDEYRVFEDGGLLSVSAPAGVLANDRDPEGNAFTAQLLTPPQHAKPGSFSLNADGSFTYDPVGDFFGTDTFTYRANETTPSVLSSPPTTVTLHVLPTNDAPTAVGDSDQSDGHPVTINVLANDTDPDGDVLRVGSFTRPAFGRVTRLGNSLVYTPNAGTLGQVQDSFNYTVVDAAGATATATVSLTVSDTLAPEVRSVQLGHGPSGAGVIDFGALSRSVLPWAQVTKFEFAFSEGVNVDRAALTVTGALGGEVPLTFGYDAIRRTATWTVAGGLGIDRYTLRLNAALVHDQSGASDGVGNPLAGDWARAFAVLPGDFDGNGLVDDADLARIQANFTRAGVPVNRYADVSGDGVVDLVDLTGAEQNKGKRV